jgi:single-strand DNA-binding protein
LFTSRRDVLHEGLIMASYNRVILLGNITRDIEVRYLQSGMAVSDVGLAVNERRKGQNGEWVDETTFVDVTMWGRTAEIAGEYLSKGSPVLIEGRLKLDQWEKDGQKRSKLYVVCDRMQMVGTKGGGGGTGGGGGGRSGPPQQQYDDSGGDLGEPAGPPARAASRSAPPSAPPPPTQDDIPF